MDGANLVILNGATFVILNGAAGGVKDLKFRTVHTPDSSVALRTTGRHGFFEKIYAGMMP